MENDEFQRMVSEILPFYNAVIIKESNLPSPIKNNSNLMLNNEAKAHGLKLFRQWLNDNKIIKLIT